MTKKEANLLIIKEVANKGWNIEKIDKVLLNNFADILHKAINYSQCCKSDSEQLIAFSDWVFEQPLHLGGNERKLVKQYLEGN